MKSFKVLLLAAIFLCSSVVIAGAYEKSSSASTTQAKSDSKVSTKKAVLNISGMEHGCCASKVKSALSQCQGVKCCNINYQTGTAEVEFTDAAVSEEKLIEAVDRCGFKASLANVETLEPAEKTTASSKNKAITQKAFLNVSGMTCSGCVPEVKSALTKVNGVKECKVSWKEGKAEVVFSGDQTNANDLVKAVNKTGFKATLANVESLEPAEDEDNDSDESGDIEDNDEAPKQMVVKDNETFKATNYVCEDCGFRQAKAGNCPMDGTKLSKVTEKHTFVCEECDYAQAKAGVCPAHKTALVEYSVKYQCPACKMVYETAGTCSMCNKKLEMRTDKPVTTSKQMMSKEKVTY